MSILSAPVFVSGKANGLMIRDFFDIFTKDFRKQYVRSCGKDRRTFPEKDSKTGKIVFKVLTPLRSIITIDRDDARSWVFYDRPYQKSAYVYFTLFARNIDCLKKELDSLKRSTSSYDKCLIIVKKTRMRFVARAQQPIDLDKTYRALRFVPRFYADKATSEKNMMNTKRVDALYDDNVKLHFQIYPYQVFLNMSLSKQQLPDIESCFKFIEQYLVPLQSVY